MLRYDQPRGINIVGGFTCSPTRVAITRVVLQRHSVYGKNGKRVIGNVLSNFFPKSVGVVGESSVESGCVNSQYTIKITIMTIIHLMEVTGSYCVFIVTKMNMPVTKLPMLMLPSIAVNPLIITLAIILLQG